MSDGFTDTARSALLWVLWHHQGGSSPVGQPIRYALGMGAHENLNAHQVQEAKRWAALAKAESNDFRQARTVPADPVNAQLMDVATGKIPHLYNGLCPDACASNPSSRDPECPACQALIAAEAQQERNLQDMHDAGREIDRVMAESARLTDSEIMQSIRHISFNEMTASTSPELSKLLPKITQKTHLTQKLVCVMMCLPED